MRFFPLSLAVAATAMACSSGDEDPQHLSTAQRNLAEQGLGSATVVHQTIVVSNTIVGMHALDPEAPIATTARGIAARLHDTLRGRCGEITLHEPDRVEVDLGADGCTFDDGPTIAGSITATVSAKSHVRLVLRSVTSNGLPLEGTLAIVPSTTNLPPMEDPPRSVDLGGKVVSGTTTLTMEPPLLVSAQSKRASTFREVRVMTPSGTFGLELWGPSSIRGECFPSWGTLRFKTDETHAFVHLTQDSGSTGSAYPVPRVFEGFTDGDPASRMSFPSYGACNAR